MTTIHESTPPSETGNLVAPALYVRGGFGYSQAKDQALGLHLAMGDQVLVEVPSDPQGFHDKRFAVEGLTHAINLSAAREVLKTADREGREAVVSSLFQQKQAEQLIDALEQNGGRPINALVSSAGALHVGLAMAARPDLFNTVILDSPAGYAPLPPARQAMVGLAKNRFKKRMNQLTGKTPVIEGSAGFDADLQESRGKSMVGGSVIPLTVAGSYHASLLSKMRQDRDAPGLSLSIGCNDPMTPGLHIMKGLQTPKDVDYILVTDGEHGFKGRPDILQAIQTELFPKTEELKKARHNGQPLLPLQERILFHGAVPDIIRAKYLEAAARVDAYSSSQPDRR